MNPFKFKIRGFSSSVDYLDYLGALPRALGLRIGGNLPWLRHWKGFILVRGSFSSLAGSLRFSFPVPGCCSLSSGPGNSAYMDLRLVLCSGTLGRILFFKPQPQDQRTT